MNTANCSDTHSAWLSDVVNYIRNNADLSYVPIMSELYSQPASPTKFAALDKLEIGQSTTFPKVLYSSLCPSIQYRKQRYGKRFKRRVDGAVVRVWRLV